jgi:hypothetical protein
MNGIKFSTNAILLKKKISYFCRIIHSQLKKTKVYALHSLCPMALNIFLISMIRVVKLQINSIKTSYNINKYISIYIYLNFFFLFQTVNIKKNDTRISYRIV